MKAEWGKRMQLILLLLVVMSGLRFFFVMKARREAEEPAKPAPAPRLSTDAYVLPPKLNAHDPVSAKALEGKTVWVRTGHSLTAFHASSAGADFNRQAGTLPPLARLEVEKVIVQKAPKADRQLMAIFKQQNKPGLLAASIGVGRGDFWAVYIDELFFLKDPRELYNHWPTEVWQTIEKNEVRPGMNELQAGFALGLGIPQGGGTFGNRTLEFQPPGRKVQVTFVNDRATDIKSIGP